MCSMYENIYDGAIVGRKQYYVLMFKVNFLGLRLFFLLLIWIKKNAIIRTGSSSKHESCRKLTQLSRKKKVEVIWTSRTQDMGWTLNSVWAAGQFQTSSLFL